MALALGLASLLTIVQHLVDTAVAPLVAWQVVLGWPGTRTGRGLASPPSWPGESRTAGSQPLSH